MKLNKLKLKLKRKTKEQILKWIMMVKLRKEDMINDQKI